MKNQLLQPSQHSNIDSTLNIIELLHKISKVNYN